MLESLVQEASFAAEGLCYAPYSHEPCGCALLTDCGVIKCGSLENCAYPNSICAVKAAVVAALARGAMEISEVAVSSTTGAVCGCCLEFLKSFVTPETPVSVLHAASKQSVTQTLAQLLPGPFAGAFRPSPFLQKAWHEDTVTATLPAPVQLPPAAGLTDEALAQLAVEACRRCYTPVSHFPVGAAVLYMNRAGKLDVAVGANVEHHVLGSGLCAERSALCSAMSKSGLGRVVKLAVVCTKLPDYGRPCGACRQGLVEYGDFPVIQCWLEHDTLLTSSETTLQILPNAFVPHSLDDEVEIQDKKQ
ncbi:cytidine deaminase [Gregarina niphandrodes]|uniref:Cytidine deaminase n=1 Tax=Gregarina niphandrodes TaxID=110365 RepID=A0A023BDA8_GRENI|nr:cytidine deaminase [Gregarina niphandrodes]EZG87025.1 cytidine deaminase [Gregarina niphandrodes]|eukprot:XP_011128717.1 cytidine deaminase [Gregarina niphandrodes]